MKPRGLKGTDAELLFEKWLSASGWTYHRAAATGFVRLPNGKSFCKSHDLFGCLDFIAFLHPPDGPTRVLGAQVTTQAGRSLRRKKLAAISWPDSWRVAVVSHERTPDPTHRGRSKHWWRIEYVGDASGTEAVEFDPKACEAHFRERKQAAKTTHLTRSVPEGTL